MLLGRSATNQQTSVQCLWGGHTTRLVRWLGKEALVEIVWSETTVFMWQLVPWSVFSFHFSLCSKRNVVSDFWAPSLLPVLTVSWSSFYIAPKCSMSSLFCVINIFLVMLHSHWLLTDPLPTVTALIRGAFGRHAWTMQLRHSARVSKVGLPAHFLLSLSCPSGICLFFHPSSFSSCRWLALVKVVMLLEWRGKWQPEWFFFFFFFCCCCCCVSS